MAWSELLVEATGLYNEEKYLKSRGVRSAANRACLPQACKLQDSGSALRVHPLRYFEAIQKINAAFDGHDGKKE